MTIEVERKAIDAITDMQQYFYQKKVALVGDPDQLVANRVSLIWLRGAPCHYRYSRENSFPE